MSRIKCRCGKIISTVQCPNNVQLRVYTDFEWDRIINMGMIDSLDIPMPQYDVIKCPSCERIYVFDNGYSEPIRVYKIEP
jgi:hypothetical protein